MYYLHKRVMLSVLLLVLSLLFCGCQEPYSVSKFDQYIHRESYDTYVKFDSDWLFYKGDIAGAESLDFDDSGWRKIDLPHDWSIEDLPVADNCEQELSVVEGQWRFHKGDDPGWKSPSLDDSSWEEVTLPDIWENHSGYKEANVYGWFRRNVAIVKDEAANGIVLLLGCIDDADEVWFNGQKVGSTGGFPPNYSSAWNKQRRYVVPVELIKGDGTDIVAVRVFDGNGDGGIYAAGVSTAPVGPFDPANSPSGHFTAHTIGGTGWYRTHFCTGYSGLQTSVRFDGVYMNAQVWLNGHLLGEHPHGYTSFSFDLTDYLNPPGECNVLAVKVRNDGRNSRWYSGSGIYRHVWLSVKKPVHIPDWGVFVTTPEITSEKAVINVSTEIENSSKRGSRSWS